MGNQPLFRQSPGGSGEWVPVYVYVRSDYDLTQGILSPRAQYARLGTLDTAAYAARLQTALSVCPPTKCRLSAYPAYIAAGRSIERQVLAYLDWHSNSSCAIRFLRAPIPPGVWQTLKRVHGMDLDAMICLRTYYNASSVLTVTPVGPAMPDRPDWTKLWNRAARQSADCISNVPHFEIIAPTGAVPFGVFSIVRP